MRLTANMPDRVIQELKVQASLERKSVSSLVIEKWLRFDIHYRRSLRKIQ
jgi:hypothetical protein